MSISIFISDLKYSRIEEKIDKVFDMLRLDAPKGDFSKSKEVLTLKCELHPKKPSPIRPSMVFRFFLRTRWSYKKFYTLPYSLFIFIQCIYNNNNNYNNNKRRGSWTFFSCLGGDVPTYPSQMSGHLGTVASSVKCYRMRVRYSQ